MISLFPVILEYRLNDFHFYVNLFPALHRYKEEKNIQFRLDQTLNVILDENYALLSISTISLSHSESSFCSISFLLCVPLA